MKGIVAAAMLAFAVLAVPSSARAITQAEVEAIYAEWLQHYAERQPDQAIAMTSSDFIMVNNETVMNREAALEFVQALAQFITSRECTNRVVAFQSLPQKSALLLSRVDCQFQTLSGPLEGHFLETIIANHKGVIVYDAFSDVANPSLP